MRENIIHKSSELFLTLGFKSVTMDDIANAMGISKKTIYVHFSNKTKLVEAVTFTVFENICNGIVLKQLILSKSYMILKCLCYSTSKMSRHHQFFN